MTLGEYYTAPPQEVFDEIKAEAIRIWSEYDDTHGYASEKINTIRDLKNVKDNAWYIISMFDPLNIKKLMDRVSKQTKWAIIKVLSSSFINY